jgi:asparagine synthase (glutamine-hydrolysing)
MCGLTGLFSGLAGGDAQRPVDAGLLRRMTGAIAHRGPDDEGFHTEPGLGLGFRRLSIIDLAASHQPMGNEDDSVMIAFNGEIYNFKSLRAELVAAGHVFKTQGDTETILHGWEEWGLGVLERLSGMFAIALWDRNQQTLLLARDRLGKKPLYYGTTPDNTLAFGSELAALAQVPGLLGRIDPKAVEDFLTFGYIPDPASIYAGIRKLPAAHFMLIRAGQPLPAPVRYWSLPDHGDLDLAAPEAAAALRSRLDEAVAARMIADVPLGAFLSGGVDSSAVVAMAARHTAEPLRSFTIGFPGPSDEREAAAAMARHCGAAHFTEVTTPRGILAAARDQARIFGEPFGDTSSVPTLAVAKLAQRHVKVALSGDGGDEVFAGYRRYRWHQIAESARRLLPEAARRRVLAPLARVYPKLDTAPRWLRAKTTLTEISLDSALGYYRTLSKTRDEQRHQLFSAATRSSLDGYDPSARILSLFNESDGTAPLRDAQRVDIATYLPGDILVKVDRTSMAVGLEVRCPILDHDLVAWGLDLPARLKLSRGTGKTVLREAVAPLLPPAILNRRKQGFAVELGGELRRESANLRKTLLGAPMLDSGLFDPLSLARMIDEHESGRFDHAQPLWLLLVMEGFLSTRDEARTAQRAAAPELQP